MSQSYHGPKRNRISLAVMPRPSYLCRMTRWIHHELYEHIPECDGYLALSIAFAQFVAVKCDADPFDQEKLAATLRESSETQELLRWLARLLQSGSLRSVSRPLGGGPIAKISSGHWQADDLVTRVLTSQYCRAEPFSPKAMADAWIFVDESDYLQLWNEHKNHFLCDPGEPQSASPRQPRRRPLISSENGGENFLLGLSAVEDAVGLRRSTIYKLIEEKRFPEQLKVGNRSLWRRTDILQWIEEAGRKDAQPWDARRNQAPKRN